jgi:hypothetical protein
MTGTVSESDAKLTPASGLAWEKAGVATTAADKTATRNTSFFIASSSYLSKLSMAWHG